MGLYDQKIREQRICIESHDYREFVCDQKIREQKMWDFTRYAIVLIWNINSLDIFPGKPWFFMAFPCVNLPQGIFSTLFAQKWRCLLIWASRQAPDLPKLLGGRRRKRAKNM